MSGDRAGGARGTPGQRACSLYPGRWPPIEFCVEFFTGGYAASSSDVIDYYYSANMLVFTENFNLRIQKLIVLSVLFIVIFCFYFVSNTR